MSKDERTGLHIEGGQNLLEEVRNVPHNVNI